MVVGDMAATAASLAPYTTLWSSVAEWFTPMVFFVLLNVVIGTIAVTSKSLSHGHSSSSSTGGAKPGADQHHLYGTGAGDDQHRFHDAAPVRQLSRTGSMLQRLKSFNLNLHMYRGYRPEEYCVAAAPEPTAAAYAGVAVAEAQTAPRKPQQQQAAPKKPAKAAAQQPRRRRDPSPPSNQPPKLLQHHHHLPEEEHSDGAAEFETLEEAFLAASGGHSTAHLNRVQSDTHPTSGEMPRKLAATMKSASTKSAFSHFEPRDLPRRPASNLFEPTADHDDAAESVVAAAAKQPQHGEVDARADDFINRFRQQLKLQRLESLMRYRDMLNRGR